MKEIKFIIAKKNGKLIRLKGYWYHDTLCRDNGIDYFNQVIETGIIQEGKIIIVECREPKHLARVKDKLILSQCNRQYWKARERATIYDYTKREPYILKEGD